MASEELQAGEAVYHLIRLARYDRDLRSLRRLERGLHEEVRRCLGQELQAGAFDEIMGAGGWIKGRVPSPSRRIGKSGGFRLIYLLLRIQKDIYLAMIYDHRSKADLSEDEKKALKAAAFEIKKAYGAGGER